MTDPVPFYMADQEFDPAIPIARLSEHPENYNKGDTEAIAKSLDQHGFFGAVLVQKSTGRIVAGNHRYRVAVAKGAATMPGFRLDIDDDEARQILADDNNTTHLATFDEVKLVALLNKAKESPRGLPATYSEAKLAQLVRHQAAITANPTNPEDDWEGMPEFDQPGIKAAARCTVHFPTEEAANLFFSLLGIPRSTFLWWPSDDGHKGVDHKQMAVIQEAGSQIVRTRPIQFACSRCGAKPGEACFTLDTHEPTGSLHNARRAMVPGYTEDGE